MAVEIHELMNATQAARYLKISRMTLCRWVDGGKVNPVMVAGRRHFKKEDLDPINEERKENDERRK